MKFQKQRDIIILISKHFEFFKSNQYSQSYGWLKFAVSHLIFAYIFCEFGALT